MNWVDVHTEKQKVSISQHRFTNRGSARPRKNQQLVIFSGECNFRFRFKIVGLERFCKIFEEIENPVATSNLMT